MNGHYFKEMVREEPEVGEVGKREVLGGVWERIQSKYITCKILIKMLRKIKKLTEKKANISTIWLRFFFSSLPVELDIKRNVL